MDFEVAKDSEVKNVPRTRKNEFKLGYSHQSNPNPFLKEIAIRDDFSHMSSVFPFRIKTLE